MIVAKEFLEFLLSRPEIQASEIGDRVAYMDSEGMEMPYCEFMLSPGSTEVRIGTNPDGTGIYDQKVLVPVWVDALGQEASAELADMVRDTINHYRGDMGDAKDCVVTADPPACIMGTGGVYRHIFNVHIRTKV